MVSRLEVNLSNPLESLSINVTLINTILTWIMQLTRYKNGDVKVQSRIIEWVIPSWIFAFFLVKKYQVRHLRGVKFEVAYFGEFMHAVAINQIHQ